MTTQNTSQQSTDKKGVSSRLVASPSIDLPKGGGALKGIEDKFQANPVTGSASFSIPLPLSPSRGGLSPEIDLSYDSGSGNGPFGLGWSLSVPNISRKTDKGLPEYCDNNESDVFIMSGSEDLVPANNPSAQRDGHTVRIYRPRIESGFAVIEQWTNNNTGIIHWRTISADNTTRIYGKSDNARISDPANERNTFKWLLEFSHDGKGSAVLYKYKSENNDGATGLISEFNRLSGNSLCTNSYLKSVLYGNFDHYSGGEYPLESDYHFNLIFDYGEHDELNPSLDDDGNNNWSFRIDPFSDYRAGFEIRTRRRCERVLMFHNFPKEKNLEDCLVRSVDFTYGHNDSDISQLISAQQKGYIRSGSAYKSKSLPAMTFTYQAHEWNDDVHEVDSDSLSGLPAGLASEGSHFIDLYGEGLSGILTESDRGWYYKRNYGSGEFGPTQAVSNRPFTGNAAGIQELEGNSEKFLVDYAGDAPGFYRLENGEAWTSQQSFKNIPNIDFNSPHVKTLDLDGDGRADLLVDEGSAFVYYRSEGQYGFKLESKCIKGHDEEKKPFVIFADVEQTIFLADMSGDGLTDIVRVRNGNICYWPNLGHGRFGAKVDMANSPMMDNKDQFSATRVRLADVDGSGAADLIYIGAYEVSVWLNKSGNGFTTQPRKFNLCSDSQTQIAVHDFLGQGTSCIVWSSPLASYSGRSMRYIDLMGGKKPHLMIGYDNGFGKKVELEYTPSTKFYLDDRSNGKPWITKLPFPVHCLSKVVAYDHVRGSRFANNYKYHHGYYDIAEREFRGFGCVEQIDTEDFEGYMGASNATDEKLHQDPVLTKTWYHLGAWIQNKGILEHYESEYHRVYREDEPKLEQPVLEDGWNAQEIREAMRAFKGMMLRQEIYALDGTDEPYTTTQTSYRIRQLQAKGDNRHAVYHVTESESLTHHYERNIDDPRIAHSLVLDVDKYDRPILAAEVVYNRKIESGILKVKTEQQKKHIVITETKYANDVTGVNVFRMGMEYEVKTWELSCRPDPTEPLYTKIALKGAFEAENNEIPFEEELKASPQKRLVEHIETVFYNEELTSFHSMGTMSSHGLVYESYTLSYTPSLLSHLYRKTPNSEILVTETMLNEGGFLKGKDRDDWEDGEDSDENEVKDNLWWARSGRELYRNANTNFYLPCSVMSAFGAVTEIEYDSDKLLITSVTDALGNEVSAVNDYRTLSPVIMTDPNGNRTAVKTDALGIVVKTAVMGKVSENEGDTLTKPTAQMKYGFATFDKVGKITKPSWVRTSSRETHGDENTRWLESVEYSDGMGEVVLVKTKAEPDRDGNERWVGTGRTVLNNKGNPVKQYEPYFSDNDRWESEANIVEKGVTPIMQYDPLSRLIKTKFPDGTHSKVEFTAWVQKDYDQNDTCNETGSHYNTPTITHLDSLGRPFYVVTNDGMGKNPVTHTILDIEGNEKEIRVTRTIDGTLHWNSVMKYKYGIHGEKGYTESMDAGERWMLFAADEQPIYTWDSRRHKLHIEYDELRRPTKQWLNDETLVGETVYGESESNTPEDNNLRGQVWKIYDQSGLVQNIKYDFKGNLLESKRQLTQEYKQTINWSGNPTLESETFTTINAYNALNRATSIKAPHNNVNMINEILPEYDDGGLLKGVKAKLRGATEATSFVEAINYNPKAQRTRIKYGNGATTKYTYDDKTFRLTRLWTFRNGGNENLQDLNYTYDPVGNITEIIDNAQQDVFFNGQHITPSKKFEYDAIYRLIMAEGREHASVNADTEPEIEGYNPAHISPEDGSAMRRYEREWKYDEVGNILEVIHLANANSWTKHHTYASDSNRLDSISIGQTTIDYSDNYNKHGSMKKMPHLQKMDWDFAERLSHVTRGTGTNVSKIYYNYDGSGERVRKVVEKNGVVETRLYLGGFEIFRKKDSTGLVLERETLHIMDDTKRIAIVETLTVGSGATAPILRYQLSNNIESATLELDNEANIISYEEYYPYGDTSYQAGRSTSEVSQKRYRYTGKEKDEESGLYYHGARYYACWLGRWTATDPTGLSDGVNLYMYCRSNPVKLLDPNGKKSWLASQWETAKQGAEIIRGTANNFGERAGNAIIERTSKALHNAGVSGNARDMIMTGAAVAAATIEAGAVFAGVMTTAVVSVGEGIENIATRRLESVTETTEDNNTVITIPISQGTPIDQIAAEGARQIIPLSEVTGFEYSITVCQNNDNGNLRLTTPNTNSHAEFVAPEGCPPGEVMAAVIHTHVNDNENFSGLDCNFAFGREIPLFLVNIHNNRIMQRMTVPPNIEIRDNVNSFIEGYEGETSTANEEFIIDINNFFDMNICPTRHVERFAF